MLRPHVERTVVCDTAAGQTFPGIQERT